MGGVDTLKGNRWDSDSLLCSHFSYQHLVLGIKFAVAYAIPDIPEWVENEIAKMEFQRREALKVYQYC